MNKLVDRFGRHIDYLRISVTDRCNLRCIYCMPKEGIRHVPVEDVLTYEEIIKIVSVCSSLGITKIRITGGEPLVRKDVIKLVSDIAGLNAIEDLSMTTNGVLLKDYARELKSVGLIRVNISLDTLDRNRFKYITGSAYLDRVLGGIREAVEVGLIPVKINMLLLDNKSIEEVKDFIKLTIEDPIHVRFLEFMPVGGLQGYRVSAEDVMIDNVESIKIYGNGPAKYFRLKGAVGTIGFIRPLSEKFCSSCNRLRLTSRGVLKGCLHSDTGINLKEPLRRGCRREELAQLIKISVQSKPKEHHLGEKPLDILECSMCQIGG